MRSTDETLPVSLDRLPTDSSTRKSHDDLPATPFSLPFGSTFSGELAAFAQAMGRLRRLDPSLADIIERRFVDPDLEVDAKKWERAGRWLLRYLRDEARRAGLEGN